MLLTLIIRLLGLTAPALWYDEWISLYRAQLPFSAYIQNTQDYTGVNLWQIILTPFAYGPPWMIRLPALAFAMLATGFAIKIVRQMGYTQAQERAALLTLACLPGLIWMADDARFYAGIALCYMGSAWAALTGRRAWLTLAAVSAFYVHPTGPAYVLPAFLLLPNWKKAILPAGITAALYLPRLYQILTVANSYGEFWTVPLTLTGFMYEYGQSLSVNTIGPFLYILFPFAALIFLLACLRSLHSTPDRIITYLAAAPLLIIVLASLTYQNVVIYRTLQPAAMGLVLLGARVLLPEKPPYALRILQALALGLIIAMLVNYNPAIKGGNIKQIAAQIRAHYQPGDLVLYANEHAGPLNLYIPSLEHCQLQQPGPNARPAFRVCAEAEIQAAQRIWLVWSHTTSFNTDKQLTWLEQITAGQEPLIVSTDAWQIAPLEIYLIEEDPGG